MDLRITITHENGDTLQRVVVYQDGSDSEGAQRIVDFITQEFKVDAFDCEHCGRHYDDGKQECTSDDCPGNESKEKNITTRIYTYDVELDLSYDGEDLVSSCFVSKVRDGTTYCSSLALLSCEGTIEGDHWGDVIHVPEKVITKIHEWAEDNGY
jgi:hypothetical protein